MVGRIFRAHGDESPNTHVQGDPENFNTARSNSIEHRLGEMKTGRRRRDGAGRVCVYRLVFLRVGRRVFSFQVWWKRNVPVSFKEILHRRVRAELKKTQTHFLEPSKLAEDTRGVTVSEHNPIACADPLSRPT